MFDWCSWFVGSLEQEDGVGVAGPLGERLPRRLEGRLRAHVRHRLQAPAVLAEVLQENGEVKAGKSALHS